MLTPHQAGLSASDYAKDNRYRNIVRYLADPETFPRRLCFHCDPDNWTWDGEADDDDCTCPSSEDEDNSRDADTCDGGRYNDKMSSHDEHEEGEEGEDEDDGMSEADKDIEVGESITFCSADYSAKAGWLLRHVANMCACDSNADDNAAAYVQSRWCA
jgi:hypothetical protein